jgi:hypothetical protein
MHYVDQGWRQVDLANSRPCPTKSDENLADVVDNGFLTLPTGPSLHAFTPRVRVLVQCARIHKRLKLSHVAATLKLPVSLLRDIEEGLTLPSNRVLELLQDVLDVHLMPDTVKTTDVTPSAFEESASL